MRAAWEEFDHPITEGQEGCHCLAEDIRKKLFLIYFGRYANTDNISEPSGLYGEESQAGWWGNNGPFREGIAFSAFGTGDLDTDDKRGPGFVDIWFDESWGPYTVVGATQNYGGSGHHEIWFEDENIDSAGNETADGNLLVDCPLEITGVNADTAELNGFWRIKSKRTVNIDGTDYILVRLEDFHQVTELVLLNDRGHPGTSYTKGGAADCNFGGDWYMFCPRAGIDGNIDFASDADMIHSYADNVRGDGEKRPPDGGRYSRNDNAWWVRTVNPYRYHHYDYNAHRWIGKAQRRGEPAVNYFTVLESWRMLPINTDPKERAAPHWYKNTGRMNWQIAGNKVEIDKEQLTDWNHMLAQQGSSAELDNSPTPGVHANDNNYQTITWDGLANFHTGQYPPMDDNAAWHKQRDVWIEEKFDTRCLWTWIEIAMRTGGFAALVNDTYRINWLEENRNVSDPVSLAGDPEGDTYEDKWTDSSGNWDLDGYRPKYNGLQNEWGYLYDKYWGENGSAIEKILSDLGKYDWWYDASNKYVPWDIMKAWGDIKFEETVNHDDPPDNGDEATADWELPRPHGTWRKVPKWSLGYVDGGTATDPGVTGFMRDYESGTPAGAEIAEFQNEQHGGAGGCANHWHFHSLYSKQAPAIGEFGNYATNLKDRHGPIHTHNSISYYERIRLVLQYMLDVLDELSFVSANPASVSVRESPAMDWTVPEADGDADLMTLHDRILLWIVANFDPDPTDWPAPEVPPPRLQSQMIYGWRDPVWKLSGSPLDFAYYRQVAIKFTGFANSNLYIEMYARITLSNMGNIATAYRHPAEIMGLDDDLITQEESTGNDIHVYLRGDKIGDEYIEFMRLWLENHGIDPVFYDAVPLVHWLATIYCTVSAELTNNDLGVIFLINWSSIPDSIWQRDDTYTKKMLLDPTADEEPPVHEPIELFLVPTIYDANKPEDDYYNLCYNWADYVAEWHIKMSSKLMMDLEDNDVEYDYVGSGGTGDPTAEDFGSGEQAEREYDFILDMGIGASAGDMDDLEAAFDNGLIDWLFKVRAKDNASDAGAGQTDNYTAYSDTEECVADKGQICSPKAFWGALPIKDGNNIILEIAESFGSKDDRSCEYKFEYLDVTWQTLQDWSSSIIATHTGAGPGFGYKYRCRGRTITGEITQILSTERLVL